MSFPTSTARNALTRWVSERRTSGTTPGCAETESPFAVTVHDHGPETVVEVTGELDVYTAPALRETLLDLNAAARVRIVVDLLGVVFLDSTALGVLVGGFKRARAAGGHLRVVCPEGPVATAFRLTGLHSVLPMYGSVEGALNREMEVADDS